MAYQLSPGVLDREIDLTGIVPGVASTEGGYVGNFNWGPLDEIVMVSNEAELVERFGKPDDNTYVSFFTAANFLSYARNLKLVRANANSNTAVANSTGGAVRIKNETDYVENYYDGSGTVGSWAAKYAGALGNSLKVSICPSDAAFSGNNSLTANAVSGANTVIFSDVVANDTGRVLAVGDYITLAGDGEKEVVAISGNTVTVNTTFSSNLSEVAVSSRWYYSDEFEDAPGTSSFASARSGANDEMHVIVVDAGGQISGIPNTVLEKFAFVSKASDAVASAGVTNYYKDVIKDRSKYIWWMDHMSGGTNWGSSAVGTTFTEVKNTETVRLSGGADVAPTNGHVMLGYDKFKDDLVDVTFLMTGEWGSTVSGYVINNVAEVRRDCVVYVSPRKADVVLNDGNEVADILSYRNAFTSSSYAFMTDNWKYQFDKYNNTFRWIPDNGDIAGISARSDFNTDPWFSPAGLNRGQMKNVTKLAWISNQSERDELYKKGVNSVVTFPGEGTVLWGDKTLLAKPSAFDRINVRRLFIVLRKAITKAARYSLFEINDRFTRAQFVAMVEPFLRDVQGRRGIYEFRVNCNEVNNTPVVIDRNEFVADIIVKPARSINFITLNFVAIGTGVTFEEVVGSF